MLRLAARQAARACRQGLKSSSVEPKSWQIVARSPVAEGVFARSLSNGCFSRTAVILKDAPKVADESSALLPEDYELATGLEREEIEAKLQGTERFETAPPRGPFGTKEAPAVVEAQYDERIVGCSGGIGEEEHDVVWFKLKKGKSHDCLVCGQAFELKVVGPGGMPGAHH
eukprot:TRINITY_DN38990_c0_g1_i1.p1 TRINITY_DN38990_c0_g1~~TRINITY_DN38990_c0_g1_i1.p1  ORF type:complete len:171 (+),score=28.21 TRINITY_DN38990_c0_g1_i1:161-673(+)